jgi:hypothetical protein
VSVVRFAENEEKQDHIVSLSRQVLLYNEQLISAAGWKP